ncbi:MAG: tyrosine-specific transport protein [Coxiella sp. RIFCSPHIGHO2_12_FULL_42_15]|nr:MAG: tyrosine-specific transport protein [Coxiella sp. RIFCSPHIGHO2_12_FULL_42_15]
MTKSKQFGSILIIAGTTVGAGMLALPIISAGEGFPYAVIVLIALWALMLYGALLLLEVNLIFPHGASFSTLGRKTLGRPGQLITNLCMVLLFYCLTAAYISGGTDFLTVDFKQYLNLSLPRWASSLIFTVVLGGLVCWHTYAVDLANRALLTVKMIAFFSVTFLLIPHIDGSKLALQPDGSRFIFMCIPIFFTAFGFHGSIPSIVKYIGHEPNRLRRIFVLGSALPLVLYILWEMVTLGILPQQGPQSFSTVMQQNSSVEAFITLLGAIINKKYLNYGINFFTDIAMTTSFLGVTLGLFDFFADMVNAKQQALKRLGVGIMTFLPPLLFALFYPKGFIVALGYAAVPLALLATILPAFMAWRTRAQYHENYPYKVAGGGIGLSIMVLFGVTIIVLQILSIFHLLPTFFVPNSTTL